VSVIKYLAFACAIALAVPLAMAADATRSADMTTIIVDDSGKPVPDPSARAADDADCSKCKPLTVGHIVSLALNGSYEDEKELGWQLRYDRSFLARKIRDDPHAALDGGEVDMIEKLLGKARIGGVVLLQVIDTIDPNVGAKKAKP